MGYLTSLVVAALVGQTHAYDPYDPIAGYSPSSDVTDQMHLDKDLKQLEDNLKVNLEGSFDIYQYGGHSKSVASLKLSDPTFDSSTIVAGKKFTGTSVDGNVAIAMKLDDSTNTLGYLKLQYEVSGQNPCNVGGLVTPDGNGCFGASGTVTDGTNVISYDSIDNMNALTLKSLGDSSTVKMGSNHEMFIKYYGKANYADHWVTQAFKGEATDFKNGNADFSEYSIIGQVEAIKKGIAYISALQYMFHKLEEAVSTCDEDVDLECWDEGVAYYVGSLQGPELAPGGGKFPYVLADKRCSNFKTCGQSPPFATGTVSWVNHNVMPKFHMGKNALVKGDCKLATTVLGQISKLVYIPLIQGTLRYAYKVQFLQSGDANVLEKEQAEGTVFAAAVLPVIYKSDKKAAATIYDNMQIGAVETNFAAVKEAFEKVYGKLHINCANVGCLIESGPNTCYSGADACPAECPDKKNTDSKKTVTVPEMGQNAVSCGELALMPAKYRHVFCANNEVEKACPGTCLGTCLCFDDPNDCEDLWNDKKFAKTCKKNKNGEVEKCPSTCAGFCDSIPFTKKYKGPKER
uniref:Uncharacterized protein n=2 Tax=Corethron hystrix TaxID=216773 RepID=A0A6U5LJH1_9STRA|mmetsp:Transcript_5813/g.12304  ORF Transcript_5813/g.12304 Transcript_5813/m.12304 type:complete len:574 (+) Transcript_5813:430-2151(+)